MAKKEESKNYPERNLAAIIVLAALLIATASFTKNRFAGPSFPGVSGMQAVDIAGSSAEICTSLPFIIYTLLLALLIVLITYLLRKHVVGHVLHTNWAYALYAMLILTVLMTILEYLVCEAVLYPVIFAIAAVIIVFIFDVLLVMMPRKNAASITAKKKAFAVRAKPMPVAAQPKQKASIFDKLRSIASSRPAQPGEIELAELKKVVKELKQLKRK